MLSQAPAKVLDEARLRRVARLRESGFEIRDEGCPEGEIGLGPRDDLVERLARSR
jgi:hypothetical protein